MMFEQFQVPIILVLFIIFLWDQFIRKIRDVRYLFIVIVVTIVVVFFVQRWKGQTHEGFYLGDQHLITKNGRQMMAFEKTRNAFVPNSPNFAPIVGPNGEQFGEHDWVVVCMGWRLNFSHWSDGHTARTYIRDGVWWYELRGYDGGNCGQYGGGNDKITFLAIPRAICNVRYPWYQDSGCGDW